MTIMICMTNDVSLHLPMKELYISLHLYTDRCDQYRWVNKGVFNVKCSDGTTLSKRSNYIDSDDLPRAQGDNRFRRWEFWGYSSYFVLHYTGDHTIFSPFAHRGAKKDQTARAFIRSAPFVKEKV